MQTVRTIQELRDILDDERLRGARIGLVPTMGAFHEGHLALMRASKLECDITVVSLFVNPTQFGDATDLAAYPRDDARDTSLASSMAVDVLFAPLVHEVYPTGFDTVVAIGGVTQPLEGQARGPLHFQGVATVVAKLFNMVQPHVAFFGQKDIQQTRVIRKLVHDLNIPVEIVVCPTVRESDGLAMSSRNVRLSPEARTQASALHEALETITHAVAHGQHNVEALVTLGRDHLVTRGIRADDVDYFEVVNGVTLEPVVTVTGEAIVALAARVGGVRLIDNALLSAGAP